MKSLKVKNFIKKVLAVTAGFGFIGMTLSGAVASGLGNLNDFQHSPIVVGDKALAEDTVGALDIANSLNLRVLTPAQPVIGRPSEATEASFSEPNDMLEVGENLSSVKESFTDSDFAGLQSGIISTGRGKTNYNQFLKFENSDGVVLHEEDENDNVKDYLRFQEGELIFEYLLQFGDGLESNIEDNHLEDLEDEQLNILGTLFDAVNVEVDGDDITVELYAGDIHDTLEEGETRTYELDGKTYEVYAMIVSDSKESAKLMVNGAITKELQKGETDYVNDVKIGIREVMPNEAEEDSGGDIVEFYLGVDKVIFTDDYTDDQYENNVEVNEEDIEDGSVKITGTKNGEKFTIHSISYKLEADGIDGNIHIAPGHRLSEYLDEKGGLLHSAWDISYDGLRSKGSTDIVFDAKNDESYRLKFVNSLNNEYSLDFITNKNDDFKYGDDDHNLVFSEDTAIEKRDAFILTNKDNEKGTTYVLTYESIDMDDKEIRIKDKSSGNSLEPLYTGTPGVDAEGTMNIGGNSYDFTVDADGNLNVDLNNDGDISADQVKIVVKGGGILSLDSDLSDGTADLKLTTLAKQFDSNEDDEILEIQISQLANEEVDIDINGIDLEEVQDDVEEGLSPYGVKVHLEDENNEPNEVTLNYPSGQTEAQVFITTKAKELSPAPKLPVRAVLASEWNGKGKAIILGGPCANPISAEILGISEKAGECTEEFEKRYAKSGQAIVKYMEYHGDIVMVVAGFRAEDTYRASQWVANDLPENFRDTLLDTSKSVVSVVNEPQP